MERDPDLRRQNCSAVTGNILVIAVELGPGAVWLETYPIEERVDGASRASGIPGTLVPFGHPA